MKIFFLLSILSFELFCLDAFISTSELKSSLEEKNIVILDASNKENYKLSHIQTAIHVDVKDFIQKENKFSLMKNSEAIHDILKNLGINQNSEIVIYSRNTKKEILNSSYLAMILLSHGFSNISILDGGYMAWAFEYELLTSKDSPSPQDVEYTHDNDLNITIDALSLNKNLSNYKLIDSRDAKKFFGVEKSSNVKKFGHIPHAKSLDYSYSFFKDNSIRNKDSLKQIYVDGLGLYKEDTIVVYADDVFSASMNWYILYNHLGFKNTKIYEASFFEWGNSDELSTKKYSW